MFIFCNDTSTKIIFKIIFFSFLENSFPEYEFPENFQLAINNHQLMRRYHNILTTPNNKHNLLSPVATAVMILAVVFAICVRQ